MTATEWFFQGHFPGLPVMPGVLQVEALAQTMAVYVAKQPGFGDRIGLFAGIDDVPLQADRRARATRSASRSRWRSSAAGSDAAAASPASTARSPARPRSRFIIPGEGSCDDPASRSSPTSTATPLALEAVRAAIRAARPDRSRSPATSSSTGPDPAGAVDVLREMEADGAMIVAGNTDIAVADFDYAAAFP